VVKVHRRPEDEGHRGQTKRSARTCTTCSIKGTTTSRVHVIHSGLVTDTGRRGQIEGSTKDSSSDTRTTVRRGSAVNWRIG
jgi:hypothetical protein